MILFDSQADPDNPTQNYTLMDWFFYFLFGGTQEAS
jgi:hypothetical protein